MNKHIFGTKAETLEFLYEQHDKDINVLKPYYFMVKEWNEDRDGILKRIINSIRSNKVIVRSSAKNEDSEQESMAGKYDSIICENNPDSLAKTINSVIGSYGEAQFDDQVLVQQAIENIECAGVVFSIEPNTGGRYYVINYDDRTGSGSSITSGNGRDTKLFYWSSEYNNYPDDLRLSEVCKAVEKLRNIFGKDELDIEFLFSEAVLYVLQVRPLIVRTKAQNSVSQAMVLKRIHDKIQTSNRSKPYLYGKRTIYGVMPDWNPAEMIGIHPKNLASSIYKEIITDEVWAYQRDNYGYKKLRSFPLMIDFCGFPYIDVRVSFNSFIPAELDENISEKLVNYYLDRLEESPHKHDKVEFDIVFSCYTFDLPERIKVLHEYGFTDQEIEAIVDSLRELTKKIIDNENGLWKKDSEKIQILQEHRNKINNSDLNNVEKAFWLLEDCKRYGTLPFAGLARAGFIAVQLLKSMVSEGIISQVENDAFMNDLQTIGSQMKEDIVSMEKDIFLNKYGFLRPGTYDLCSKRYDEASDIYFKWDNSKICEDDSKNAYAVNEKFRLSLNQMENIRNTLLHHDMGDDVLGLFSFIKGAIEGREKAKFLFTQNVSDILLLMGEWGEKYGFPREEIAFSDIRIIKSAYKGAVDEKEIIEKSIIEGKEKYQEGLGIVLPPVIVNEDQVYSFFVPDSQPNFVTQKRVVGEICKDIVKHQNSVDGKILLIESADPGYDWIFSHDIKGFITKYGGANSHMAIRAGELSIPAVIGVGSKYYDKFNSANTVEIDAANKIIRVLR